jgi:hypothetical protein
LDAEPPTTASTIASAEMASGIRNLARYLTTGLRVRVSMKARAIGSRISLP